MNEKRHFCSQIASYEFFFGIEMAAFLEVEQTFVLSLRYFLWDVWVSWRKNEFTRLLFGIENVCDLRFHFVERIKFTIFLVCSKTSRL